VRTNKNKSKSTKYPQLGSSMTGLDVCGWGALAYSELERGRYGKTRQIKWQCKTQQMAMMMLTMATVDRAQTQGIWG
jgi:hypothetical protein